MKNDTQQPASVDEAKGQGTLAPATGSATFTIQRGEYPPHFHGFNKYGYTSWTSNELNAMPVKAEELGDTMKRIQESPYSKADKISATLLPNEKAEARRRKPKRMNTETTIEPPAIPPLPPATGSAATYWHEIPQAEQEKIIKESGLTVAQFLEKYKQPDWCEYPEALAGQMGCWSLMLSRSIHCKSDCGDCDCIAKPPNVEASEPGTMTHDNPKPEAANPRRNPGSLR